MDASKLLPEKYILRTCADNVIEVPFDDIQLLEPGITYSGNVLYVGSVSDVASAMQDSLAEDRGLTFFAAAPRAGEPILSQFHRGISVTETNLPLASLYNRLNFALKTIAPVGGRDALSYFFQDMCQKKLNSRVELQLALQELGFTVKRFCCIITLRFLNALQVEFIRSRLIELKRIFPGAFAIPVQEGFVIILFGDRWQELPTREQEGHLNALLERDSGIACVGVPFEELETMQMQYAIQCGILRHVPHYDDMRIYHQKVFSIFYVLDLCCKQFEKQFPGARMDCLAHPGIIDLQVYDREHNTNLGEILRRFLYNNQNINMTAKDMFMHRNTLLARLNLIRELIQDDFTDNRVDFSLTLSYMTFSYCKTHNKAYFIE